MGLVEEAAKALEYLSPLYGKKRFTLDTLPADGKANLIKSIKETSRQLRDKIKDHNACTGYFAAAENVGDELLEKYNGDAFDPGGIGTDIGGVVTSAGGAYAGHAYHAHKCGCKIFVPDTTSVSETITKLVRTLEKRSNMQGVVKMVAGMAITTYAYDAGKILGYLLFKHHTTTKFSELAHMTLEEAVHLLRETMQQDPEMN